MAFFPLKRTDGWRVFDSDMECVGGPFRHRRKAEERIKQIEQDKRDLDELCLEFGCEEPKKRWIDSKLRRNRQVG